LGESSYSFSLAIGSKRSGKTLRWENAAVPIQESVFAFSHAGFATRSASLRLPRIYEGHRLLRRAGSGRRPRERERQDSYEYPLQNRSCKSGQDAA
jgi:hypothetical protein